MKKYLLLLLLIVIPVEGKVTYIVNERKNKLITYSDNYDYGKYNIEKGDILNVSKDEGILSNDIYDGIPKIKIIESSLNSHLDDLIMYDDGSFMYKPSDDVVGFVTFKYYIETDIYSNTSEICFYVKNKVVNYYVNYYDEYNNLIVPSIKKITTLNSIVTEYPLRIDGYNIKNKEGTSKKITNSDNEFNFYYVSYIDRVNTGI